VESWIPATALLGSAAIGATIAWLFLRGPLARLRRDLRAQTDELIKTRQESEAWRTKHQEEQLARARFETEAARIVGLQSDLQQIRARTETLATEKAALQMEAGRLPALEAHLIEVTGQVADLKAANAQLQTQLQQEAQAHVEKVAALAEIRGSIESDLKNIAAQALHTNQGAFLQLANQVFEKHQVGAEAVLEARQRAVEGLISPIQETLQSYKRQVEEMDRARSQSYGTLSAELKAVVDGQNAVRAEASKLANALRAAPKTRGRWGEQTLLNVIELSGLSPYCDYSPEQSLAHENGRTVRPDLIIRLPGGRHIVVDAKTSLSAYLEAIDALDDNERNQKLNLHANQIRTHVKQLADKAYWEALTVTPDFVVMFVPGDNFYAAAIERDPMLFEDAAKQRVIIVTPATLIALAKAIAFGWRQEKVAENAQRVHDLGRELYGRMMTMASHIKNCSNAFGKSVKCFNQFIGSLEHSVMPQARRFRELEVEGTTAEIPILKPIDREVRSLRPDGEFAEGDAPLPVPALVDPS
jgi:DNA recombination protein RmuC